MDILSHNKREDKIHILTLDEVLARDIYERIYYDPRMKQYQLVKPQKTKLNEMVEEIDSMARDTISSRLLIIDVRKDTLSLLQKPYNKIVGYNRRDLNKWCHTIVIGDGPINLFQAGTTMDVFVSHIAAHRIDYHPAVFFYDPFLHYESHEIQQRSFDSLIVLPDKLPQRFSSFFEKKAQDISVDKVRQFFRASGKNEQIRKERLKKLRKIYKKRIVEQFPHHKEQLKAWLSREGIRLGSEKLHLYPLFFEDWVYHLMQKAAQSRI